MPTPAIGAYSKSLWHSFSTHVCPWQELFGMEKMAAWALAHRDHSSWMQWASDATQSPVNVLHWWCLPPILMLYSLCTIFLCRRPFLIKETYPCPLLITHHSLLLPLLSGPLLNFTIKINSSWCTHFYISQPFGLNVLARTSWVTVCDFNISITDFVLFISYLPILIISSISSSNLIFSSLFRFLACLSLIYSMSITNFISYLSLFVFTRLVFSLTTYIITFFLLGIFSYQLFFLLYHLIHFLNIFLKFLQLGSSICLKSTLSLLFSSLLMMTWLVIIASVTSILTSSLVWFWLLHNSFSLFKFSTFFALYSFPPCLNGQHMVVQMHLPWRYRNEVRIHELQN